MPPTLTHSTNPVDALRHSSVEFVAMMGSKKMTASGLKYSSLSVGISASVSELGILIVGVLLLITGCGPPI